MAVTTTGGELESSAIQLPPQKFSSGRNPFTAGLADLSEGFLKVQLWTELAWEDFIKRYRRSFFGALWATFSFAIFALAILFFFTSITGDEVQGTLAYIVLGFLFFQLLSSIIIDGSQVFVIASNWLKSARLPLSIFVYKDILRILIVFGFNAVGAGALLLWSGYEIPDGAWWALAGMAVTILNAVWVYLLLGVVVSRLRDLAHLINAFMRMAFFMTPVMWEPAENGYRAYVSLYNPLTHFIAINRQPFLDGSLPQTSWIIVGCITIVGWLIALLAFCLLRRRVIFWV